MDTATRKITHDLPSGPDPELGVLHPSGNPLYVANEDDNLVTAIDVDDAARSAPRSRSASSPRAWAISPDGKVLVNTSETTNMAHFIDTETHEIFANVLVDQRPRFAEFTRDGKLLYVSAEIGGTVSVIDPAAHEIVHTINFEVPGVPPEALQPVGMRVTDDGTKVFVALGPANRVAVVDGETWEVQHYLLVGQRVWQLAFTPDEKYLFTTNGISNDVSVIDVANERSSSRSRSASSPGAWPSRRTEMTWRKLDESDWHSPRDRGTRLPARRSAQNRTLEIGMAGLMERSNRTDLPPINLTAGELKAGGEYKLLSGGYYRIDIISDGTQEIAVEGPGLFRAVWINEVVINDLEVRPLGLDSIEFDDEGTVSLSFVAITPGQYDIRIRGTTGETQRAAFAIQ